LLQGIFGQDSLGLVAVTKLNFAITSRQIYKTYCDCLDFAALQQAGLPLCQDRGIFQTLPGLVRLGYLSQLSV
jgi:hypothetical protein